MRNLLNFLVKYNNLIIFLFLQGIAFYWLTTGNNYHNSVMVKSIQSVTRGVEQRISNLRAYLNLREINSDLAAENEALKNTIEKLAKKENHRLTPVSDSISRQQYTVTIAEVINNSVNRQKNYFTLNKGRRQGLAPDMAVTVSDKVAGVIAGCSENYSVAISLLNIDFRVSARIKTSGYFGSLNWNGYNPQYAVLNEIPQHISISVGDTVETTSYSAIFPEGTLIGTISDVKKSGSDFYKIEVELFTDFRKLRYVNVIGNLQKPEQQSLEKQFQ
ncbi:MAG TPA: rod shape-determining protein MreC [Bacteroidales bacterium]|nr:rod shape-determining protein MreC [Bacteroidales bacterium]HNR41226.1 rod shape-determining protein MreC [Bacteroidales bacterium]